ncbi:DUF2336 domain-containing protein [Amphiplicatus metriothermophilus]|uniref:Uncharacterized conserved protein, DUF2336 family n=1 Tax=Amphiplicatus metriothermophilus TaxID=1519374 RepID=A0A239PZY4_9PROT|nr:DUF2336 domain-containing protein [Amphiplicatus metriothermophilus]MBB5518268.1 uncharacterized protein (DUF2336 family) [Amphiplicatus metriothermophilus]SNT75502.1 Uncharacterized conserved protein, DUF2336 family [Amphiplicatus metriothermophilus]
MSGGAARLLALIEEARRDRRAGLDRLACALTDLRLAAPGKCDAAAFDETLCALAARATPETRRLLAERFAAADGAPRALVRRLAADEAIEIAEPVLRRSAALTEEDLIAIAQHGGPAHVAALACRRAVSARLAAAIVARGEKAGLVYLARNRGARLNDASLAALVAQARAIPELQAPLTARPDLSPLLMTRLYFAVASPLKREILRKADMLDPALIDAAIDACRSRLLAPSAETSPDPLETARQFIRSRIGTRSLNERLLRQMLDARRPAEFMLAFAYCVGVDIRAAQTILQDRSWESLAVACRAAGIERATFAKLIVGLRKTPEEQKSGAQMLEIYMKIPQEAAERVMRFWRARHTPLADLERKKKTSIAAVAPRLAG